MPIVETERLTLRPWREDDVDELVALDADPEVMRFITGGRPSSREWVEQRIRDVGAERWMAYHRETGRFVGWFGLSPDAGATDGLELGYRLRREWWRQGLATEGSLALIDLAFTELSARRVWAQTMTVNAGSRGVMERCGLRFVRTFFGDYEAIPGSDEGDVEYELLSVDWERGRAAGGDGAGRSRA